MTQNLHLLIIQYIIQSEIICKVFIPVYGLLSTISTSSSVHL